MAAITKRLYIQATYISVYKQAHRLALFVTLIVYLWTGQSLTAEKVFFSATIFIPLVHTLVLNMPSSFASVGEAFVAAKRIQVASFLVH